MTFDRLIPPRHQQQQQSFSVAGSCAPSRPSVTPAPHGRPVPTLRKGPPAPPGPAGLGPQYLPGVFKTSLRTICMFESDPSSTLSWPSHLGCTIVFCTSISPTHGLSSSARAVWIWLQISTHRLKVSLVGWTCACGYGSWSSAY